MNEGELEFMRTVMRAEQASRADERTTGCRSVTRRTTAGSAGSNS